MLTWLLIKATIGFELMCFMDVSSGYHQIHIHPRGEKKTVFITKERNFYYTRMPFGLKKVGQLIRDYLTNVQKLDRKKYRSIRGWHMVKTKSTREHVSNLQELFAIIGHYKMRLNLKKCVFGVTLGKFLGYLVCFWGIKANSDKFANLIKMRSPHCLE